MSATIKKFTIGLWACKVWPGCSVGVEERQVCGGGVVIGVEGRNVCVCGGGVVTGVVVCVTRGSNVGCYDIV